ncbi:MAG: metallophosphoesterase [Candidatus Caenarcaniphilales bacterium]|nr:metallophosphoesterase [Candidatus Caenarcaniphilales bacterium]
MSDINRRDFLKKALTGLLTIGASSFTSFVNAFTSTETISSKNRWLPELTGDRAGFLALGDMGTGWKTEHDLVSLMTRYPTQEYPGVLLLGDLSYPSAEKHLLHQNIIDPFTPLFVRDYRFYPCWGNHDWKAEKARHVKEYFAAPDYFSFKIGPAEFWSLNSNLFDQKQAQWLDGCLAHSKAIWKIAFCHHPPYSSGKTHGGSTDLVRDLCPILSRHKVDLCLSGHDHLYERFNPIQGVNYIVSGGGSASLYDFKTETNLPRAFVKKCHHFLAVKYDTHQLSIKAIDLSGKTFDQSSVTKNF